MGSRVAVFFSSATVAGAFSMYFPEPPNLGFFIYKINRWPFGGCYCEDERDRRQTRLLLVVFQLLKCKLTASNVGWAWIFILEGLATVVAGLFSYWIIQDFPDTAKFLSEEERMLRDYITLCKII